MYSNVSVNCKKQSLAGLIGNHSKYLADKVIYSLIALSFEIQQIITTSCEKETKNYKKE